MTANIVADELGLGGADGFSTLVSYLLSYAGPGSIHVEQGLVEQAKSFRGKTSGEPRPNWSPLLYSVGSVELFRSVFDFFIYIMDRRKS